MVGAILKTWKRWLDILCVGVTPRSSTNDDKKVEIKNITLFPAHSLKHQYIPVIVLKIYQ